MNTGANWMTVSTKPPWLHEKWFYFRKGINIDICSVRHWIICLKNVLAASDNVNLIIVLMKETFDTKGLHSSAQCLTDWHWRVLVPLHRMQAIEGFWMQWAEEDTPANPVLWNSNDENEINKKGCSDLALRAFKDVGRKIHKNTWGARLCGSGLHLRNAAAL